MPKSLVTGAAGMIGCNLVQRLIKEGHEVTALYHMSLPRFYHGDIQPDRMIEVDLTKQDDCIKAFKGQDYIFHAAGKSYGAMTQQENILNLVFPNITINMNALNAAYVNGIQKFIWFSSTTGYPETTEIVSEDMFFHYQPSLKYFGVGWMKRYSETLCELFSTIIESPMQCLVARVSSVVGPRDEFNPNKSHVFQAILKKVSDRDNPLVIWGDGSDTRDFIYIDDLIDAILLMIAKIDGFCPLNIASGESFSCLALAELMISIRQLLDNDEFCPTISLDKSKPRTLPIRRVNIDKAKTLLNWQPKHNINTMILKTMLWLRENNK